MPIRVLYSVTNSVRYDRRVLKMASVANELGADVTIVGRAGYGERKLEMAPFRIILFRLPVRRGFLFYLTYNIRLLLHLATHSYDVIVSNDLDTLLPAWLVSRARRRCRLIFDSHEYFTGVPELKDRPKVRAVWKAMERFILPHLKNVITVSDEIAAAYKSEYGIDAVVIMNCSESVSMIKPVDRSLLLAENKKLLCVIQGTGLNIDSGVEELIKAIEKIDGAHLLIIGSGLVIPAMMTYVASVETPEKFTFLPVMEWERMMAYTRSADIGFFLHKPETPNPSMSMPNKVFEYMAAGIGMVVSPVEGVRRLVEESNSGISVPVVTSEELSKVIQRLIESPGLVSELKNNSLAAFKKNSWSLEKQKVEKLYKNIFSDGR